MITNFNTYNFKYTLSDIVYGNFKVVLKKHNNYYTEFYIDNILVASIHTNNEKLYIDNIFKIIEPMITLTTKQKEHILSLSIKKINKNSIKKGIRNILEDLLYIDITPVELTNFAYTDFKK
jgi:hypothetical protein